jgi:hypothetical protein
MVRPPALFFPIRNGPEPVFLAMAFANQVSNRKIPWRLSRHQKYRQRERLRKVDNIVATLDRALARQGEKMKKVERWKEEMPTEGEMLAKDKYTVFDRKVKRYRKGIHSKLVSFYFVVWGPGSWAGAEKERKSRSGVTRWCTKL